MEVKNELDRRIKHGVLNIEISPLFEKGKYYDIDTKKEIAESVGGCLAPDVTYCWLTWESKLVNVDSKEVTWSNEAFSFSSIEEAEKAKKYLETHLI